MAPTPRGGAPRSATKDQGRPKPNHAKMADAPAPTRPPIDERVAIQESQMAEPKKSDAPAPSAPAPSAPAAAPTPANGGRRDSQLVETQLQWDDRKMATTFANVVNIQSTREQVDLFFGTNQTWNATSDRTLPIELS